MLDVPLHDSWGDAKTEEASKEHEHEAASWILHTKVRMVFFLVLWNQGSSLSLSHHLGVASRLTYVLVGGNFQTYNHDQSRLKDLVIVGIGRRGCPSLYVRHSQQTDRMLDRRSQATSFVFFFFLLLRWSRSLPWVPVQKVSPALR